MATTDSSPKSQGTSLAATMLLMGMAGGLGWGIRGQYGHESGAMIAGVLVGCVVVLCFARNLGSLRAARIVAFFAIGISVGGSMTYGQTVGLTHDDALVGNWQALAWGYLGLLIKGGLWIGIASAIMATQLGRIRYRSVELCLLCVALVFVWFIGVYFLNEPFDPAARTLPKIYFSDSWDWEPDAELEPRREVWGGLAVVFATLIGYARFARRDRLVLRLGIWGFVAGGLGFPNGQMLAAASRWNPDWLASAVPLPAWRAWIESYWPYVNWWNMMEISFGTIFGAILALGLWCNRSLLDDGFVPSTRPARPQLQDGRLGTPFQLTAEAELALGALYLIALLAQNFLDFGTFDRFSDQALTMIVIPLVAVASGAWWPYFLVLPLTLLPIAGKTVRQLVFEESIVRESIGWVAYGFVPLVIVSCLAYWMKRKSDAHSASLFAASTLLAATWTYFGLNFAFFHYPWPWTEWTGRTPSAIIFTIDALGLTAAAIFSITNSQANASSVS